MGCSVKADENSVPPAKSMPRGKSRVAIDTMPGMMMISEIARKNQFRRPDDVELPDAGLAARC